MTPKQLTILGGAVALGAKFYLASDWKKAAILGVGAVLVAGIVDNLAPATA